jgi:hypothetical protein
MSSLQAFGKYHWKAAREGRLGIIGVGIETGMLLHGKGLGKQRVSSRNCLCDTL